MSRLLLRLVMLTAFCLGGPETALSQSSVDQPGRVVEVEIPAPALAGNLLGTRDVQTAAIYLPPSYDSTGERRYPVIYLLHGIFDDFRVWLDIEDVPARLDRAMAREAIPEALVVMPNGGNKYGGGFYRNSPISGRWADFITTDLVRYIETRFRTLGENNRAVVGHSMGGYGALHLAITRPGTFSVVWAMSPCCLAAVDDFGFGNDAWKRAAGITAPEDIEQMMVDRDFFAIAALGVLSAFSTTVHEPPLYAKFPFDIVRGEVVLNDAAYDRYLDSLPIRQVREGREALRKLRGLGLGVGLNDQFRHIPPGTIAFSQRLGAERIPHILEVYEGDHRQAVGARLETVVLPWVGARLIEGD
ncbi:alpha/beta hydrolase [Pseudohoeflea coraliihabitans]|uniref:Esterase family protein n=1 Tax=Pseudohoeflea coraliihabitans TaxID=2860393 RepID=A0ABS6WSH7_9HYPH|nr:alpha/beta fold hydrolase [Pseudohoeflea sp. DP4N28-3]MBW3098903.1 esterase family protein [Pseudohoeflea sp. DP4N28-3]